LASCAAAGSPESRAARAAARRASSSLGWGVGFWVDEGWCTGVWAELAQGTSKVSTAITEQKTL